MSKVCAITPIQGVVDQYIILDSFLKLRESKIEQGEFKWNILSNGTTSETEVGISHELDNIIEIQIGSFNMQYLPVTAPPTATTISFGSNPGPLVFDQLSFTRSFTIQIRESGIQSYSDLNGLRHNFEFTVQDQISTGPAIKTASPLYGGWDTFVFTYPLRDLKSFTLVFRDPDLPIKFQPDCYYDAIVQAHQIGSNYFIRFRIDNHNLSVHDKIIVSGFKSDNHELNIYINNPEGLIISGSPGTTPISGALITGNHFWTDPSININSLFPFSSFLTAVKTVHIVKRRMRIQLKVRSLVNRTTNYKTI